MKLSYVVLGLVIAGSLWSPGTSEIGPGEVARIETGVTTYREIQHRWGAGKLVGRSGPRCGAIRSVYALQDERRIELSWKRGVVCDWKVERV